MLLSKGSRFPIVLGLVLAILLAGHASSTTFVGSLTGRVTASDGTPATDAVIRLVNLRRDLQVDQAGEFHLDQLPVGEHLLEVTSTRHGSQVLKVSIDEAARTTLEIALQARTFSSEIVVSAGLEVRTATELYQPATVLSGSELQARSNVSLGETVAREAGVSTTYFGPAVGRPIIRGLGNDRVRVLSGGTDVGDISAGAPDHAVTVDTLSAERIEILRGPATLLYGSSATGGVVNVIDGRVPEKAPSKTFTGQIEGHAGSAADETGGAISLSGRLGSKVAWNVNTSRRETGDYDIPGFASQEPEVDDHGEIEEPFGRLENSALETEFSSAGLSYVTGNGFFGLAVTNVDATYGLPGALEGHGHGHGHGDEEGEEAGPMTVLEQQRFDLRGEWRRSFGVLDGFRFLLSYNDYEHIEAEGTEFGKFNTKESWEGRFETRHKPVGALSGTLGVQIRHRDVASIGEEAFVPQSDAENYAIFGLEELVRGDWRWQLGLRYETQDIGGDPSAAPARSHDSLSGSVGFVWKPQSRYPIAVSTTRAAKFPSARELYSDGAHLATRSFELGNPDLEEETNLGIDVTLRRQNARLTGEINLFANRFDDFIYQQFTGEERQGLPLLPYTQADSEFAGGELRARMELLDSAQRALSLELGLDYVRAELRASGEPLPRIPALRYHAGLDYRGERFWGLLEVRHVDDQSRVAELERPTDGYTMVNAGLGFRILTEALIHDVVLRCTNLGDEEIRAHTSFLKDLVPQPGRDVSLSYRVSF